MTTRAEALRNRKPQLIADVTLYSTSEGGKKFPAQPGWGCPCCCSREKTDCYDAWPILDEPLAPGETRRVGFMFLSGEIAAETFRKAGKFYLCEGRIIGEATVLQP